MKATDITEDSVSNETAEEQALRLFGKTIGILLKASNKTGVAIIDPDTGENFAVFSKDGKITIQPTTPIEHDGAWLNLVDSSEVH